MVNMCVLWRTFTRNMLSFPICHNLSKLKRLSWNTLAHHLEIMSCFRRTVRNAVMPNLYPCHTELLGVHLEYQFGKRSCWSSRSLLSRIPTSMVFQGAVKLDLVGQSVLGPLGSRKSESLRIHSSGKPSLQWQHLQLQSPYFVFQSVSSRIMYSRQRQKGKRTVSDKN